MKTLFLAHPRKAFKITFFSSERSSKESQVYLKPATDSFRANTESVLGFITNDKLLHFAHHFEVERQAVSAEGCVSLFKVQGYPMRDRVIVFINQR